MLLLRRHILLLLSITRGVGKRLPRGIPTTYAHTGYDGSQTSAMPDNANPEREPTRSALGYPMPLSFSSNDVDGRGAAERSMTEAGNPFALFSTGAIPATTNLAATQTRTQTTVTQQATSQSASSQGAHQGAPTAEAGAADQRGGPPQGNGNGNGNDQGNGNGGDGRDPPPKR